MSLLRAAPQPTLTRTKITTALRSRNSAPNGTRLPDASSTGSSATAATSGCTFSGPLGAGDGVARPLTCRVTGARAAAAIAPCIRRPRFTPTQRWRDAQDLIDRALSGWTLETRLKGPGPIRAGRAGEAGRGGGGARGEGAACGKVGVPRV